MINGLPQKLIDLRLKYGFSQREVSRRTGISQTSVCQYESGDRDPSIDALISLSHLYHCSIDYLLKNNVTDDSIVIERDSLSPQKYELLKTFLKTLNDV